MSAPGEIALHPAVAAPKREARHRVRLSLMGVMAAWAFLMAAYLAELPLEINAQNQKLAHEPAPYLSSTPYLAFDGTWFFLLFSLLIAGWVLFALWFGAVYPLLANLGAGKSRISPGAAAALTWVPFADLVVPFAALRSAATAHSREGERPLIWVTAWWVFWVLAVLGLTWLLTSNIYLPNTPSITLVQDYVSIPWAIAGIVASVSGFRSLQLLARIEPAETARIQTASGKVRTMPAWMGMAGLGAMFLIPFGTAIAMFALSASASADAASYKVATTCSALVQTSNCYLDQELTITRVDVSQGRSGETDTVHFQTSTGSHEAAARPGRLDSSLLRTGAVGSARLWHQKYTDLIVGGEDFPTIDNPAYNQNEYRTIGVIALVVGLLYLAPFAYAFGRVRRRRQVKATVGAGMVRTQSYSSTAELLQGVPGQPVMVKPKSPKTLLLTLLGGLAALALIDLTSFSSSRVLQIVMGVGFGVLFIVLISWQTLYRLQGGLFADESSFGEVRQLGRRRSFPRSSAARIDIRRLVTPGGRSRPLVAILFDREGHYLYRVAVAAYGVEAIERFGQSLGVPVDGGEEPPEITLRELNATASGSVSWIAGHPRLVGVLFALVLMAAIIPVVILTSGPSHR